MSEKDETKGKRSRSYSDDEIREALAAYVRTGKITMAADECDIPVRTLHHWVHAPRWASTVADLRHAHAREIRDAFAAGASSFASTIADTKLAMEKRLAQMLASLDAGQVVNGKELASMLRALSASSMDVARLGDVVTDPAAQGSAIPTRFVVQLEAPAEDSGTE